MAFIMPNSDVSLLLKRVNAHQPMRVRDGTLPLALTSS